MEIIDSLQALLIRLVAFGVPFTLALVVPVIGIFIIVGLQRGHAFVLPSARLGAIMILLMVGTSLSVALSGRSLLTAEAIFANPFLLSTVTPLPYGRLASQFSTIIILVIAVSEIAGWLINRDRRIAGGPLIVLLSLLLYFVLSVVISGIFGVFRNPRLNDLYFPLVAVALATLAHGAVSGFWRSLRIALALFSLASVGLVFLFPDLAVAQHFRQTVIPGVNFRWYGTADHANALGFIAAIALVLEFSTHVRRRPALWLVVLHGVVLVFSQSKTAWIAFLVGVMVVRYQWLRYDFLRGDGFKAAAVSILVVIAVCITVVLAVYSAAGSERLVSYLENIGLFTFTGRVAIWAVAWDEFLKSPVTGYGPSIWDPEFRAERGIYFAGQAHNQFMHVLGQAGLLGFFGILIHLGVLLYFAFTRRSIDRGLALALFLMLIIRCWSESPLRLGAIMGWDAFIHLIAFVATVGLAVHPHPKLRHNTSSNPTALSRNFA